MGWPTDPVKRALAAQRHQEAQRKRWENQEARERHRAIATAQWSDPAARERMSQIKLRQFQERPEIAVRISASLSGKYTPSTARTMAILEANRRKRMRKVARLDLIRQRAAESLNGQAQGIGVRPGTKN